jgi:hypothetical protein
MSFNDGFNIRSVPWPPNTPVSGNSLVYNGTQWVAANVSGSGGGGTGDITSVNAGTNMTGGGASGDVTISLSASLSGIDKIDFTTGNLANPPFQTGRLYCDINTFDLQYNTVVNDVSMNLGQQLVVKVKNDSLATINKGKLVRIVGGLGNNPTISTASWDSDGLSANTLGMMMNTVAHNDFGYVILNGVLIGVNTNSFSAGQVLYLSSSGDYTNVKPVAPKHTVTIGEVIRVGNSSVGSLFVNISNGYEIGELHDVSASASVNGDLLIYDSASSIWKNTKTLSGSYTVTGSITASNFVGTLIGSMSSSLYSREWHVSTGSGNDVTGNGTLLNPYRTVAAGIAAASTQGGDQVVIHPGTYIEDVTMGKFNTTICAAQGTNGGEVNISGTMIVSQSIAPASSIRLFGLSVFNLTHNGTGSLFLENCKINNTFTKATTAYFRANNCDFNRNISIVSGGLTEFQGGNQSASGSSFVINNANAFVTIRDSITTYSPVLISGTLGINDCALVATSSGGPAVTSISPSSIVQIVDSTTLDTSTPLPLPTKVTIGGFFTYSNSVFNKTTSTLGTLLGAVADFETIRANLVSTTTATATTITGSNVTGSTARFTTISGSTVTGSTALFTTITGSNVTGSTARFTTITASNFSAGGTLQANNVDVNGTLSILGFNPNSLIIKDVLNTTDILIYNNAVENLNLYSSLDPSSSLTLAADFVNVSNDTNTAQLSIVPGTDVKLDFYVSASSGIIPSIIVKESNTLNSVPLKIDALELDVNNINIINVAYPNTGSDAANKQYVDDIISGSIPYSASNSADWASPTPTTVGEAIDRIAALLATLNGNPIP